MRYLVIRIPGAVPNCNTFEDLERYLATDPEPDYRLVSVLSSNGTFRLVWELKE